MIEIRNQIIELQFQKFLQAVDLTEYDLKMAYCYWKGQEDLSNKIPVKVSHLNIYLKLEGFSSEDELKIRSSLEKLNKLFPELSFSPIFKLRIQESISKPDSRFKPAPSQRVLQHSA